MTDQQIERLEEIIWGFMEDPIGIDEIQATFAAIAAGPTVVKPSQWLPFLFDEEETGYPYVDEEDADEFMNLLLELYDETADHVLQETFSPFFRYYEDDAEDALDPTAWCAMFYLAFELHGEDTIPEDNDELMKMFLPVVFFLDPDTVYKDMQKNTDMTHALEEVRDIMMDALHEVVYDVRDHFHPPQATEEPPPTGRILPFDPTRRTP